MRRRIRTRAARRCGAWIENASGSSVQSNSRAFSLRFPRRLPCAPAHGQKVFVAAFLKIELEPLRGLARVAADSLVNESDLEKRSGIVRTNAPLDFQLANRGIAVPLNGGQLSQRQMNAGKARLDCPRAQKCILGSGQLVDLQKNETERAIGFRARAAALKVFVQDR